MDTTAVDPRQFLAMVQGIYRLFRVATFHQLTNDAIDVAIGQCLESLRPLVNSGHGLTLLFARETVIVNGQLLQAPPDIYALAMEFGEFLHAADVNSLSVGREVEEADLRSLLVFFNERKSLLLQLDLSEEDADALDDTELARPAKHTIIPDDKGYISPSIRLRTIAERFLLGLEDPTLSAFERIMLTYALATLVIRRLGEATARGQFEVPAYFKRVARQLAQVNYVERPRILDIIVTQHLEDDEAKRAVNSAILTVAMARLLTRNDTVLSRVCLTTMLLGMGRYRPAALEEALTGRERALATAAVHIGSGRLRGDSVERALVSFESISLLEGLPGDIVYSQHEPPTIDAYLTMTARRFIDRLTDHRSAGRPISMDLVVERMRREVDSDVARICLDLLVSALSLLPRGSAVELDNGHRGIVTRAGARPSAFDRPRVRLYLDASGRRLDDPIEVDLGDDADWTRYGGVTRMLTAPGAILEAARRTDWADAFAWDAERARVVDALSTRLDEADARVTAAATRAAASAVSDADDAPEFHPAPTDEFDVARHSGVHEITGSFRARAHTTGRHPILTGNHEFADRPRSSARRRPGSGDHEFADRPRSSLRRATGESGEREIIERTSTGTRHRTATPANAPRRVASAASATLRADSPTDDRRSAELSRRGAQHSDELDGLLASYLEPGADPAVEQAAAPAPAASAPTRHAETTPAAGSEASDFERGAGTGIRRRRTTTMQPVATPLKPTQPEPAHEAGDTEAEAGREDASGRRARRARRNMTSQMAAVATPGTAPSPAGSSENLDDLLRGFVDDDAGD